jgi:hypothetical protein
MMVVVRLTSSAIPSLPKPYESRALAPRDEVPKNDQSTLGLAFFKVGGIAGRLL